MNCVFMFSNSFMKCFGEKRCFFSSRSDCQSSIDECIRQWHDLLCCTRSSKTHTLELLFHTRPQLLLHVFIVFVLFFIIFFWLEKTLFPKFGKKVKMHHTTNSEMHHVVHGHFRLCVLLVRAICLWTSNGCSTLASPTSP